MGCEEAARRKEKYITVEIISKEYCRKLNAWEYDGDKVPDTQTISGDDISFAPISVSIPGKYKMDIVYYDGSMVEIWRETSIKLIEVHFDPCKENPWCPPRVIPLPTHNMSKNMRKLQCNGCKKGVDQATIDRMVKSQRLSVGNRIRNKF